MKNFEIFKMFSFQNVRKHKHENQYPPSSEKCEKINLYTTKATEKRDEKLVGGGKNF